MSHEVYIRLREVSTKYQVPSRGIYLPESITNPVVTVYTPTLYYNGVDIVWTFPAPNPTGWVVQFSSNGTSNWDDVTSQVGTNRQFEKLSPGFYRVFGFDTGGNQFTNFSNVVQVSIVVLQTDYPSLDWSWTGAEPTSWMVAFSTDETNWTELEILGPGARSVALPAPAVVIGQPTVSDYFYQVYGIGTDGSSVTPVSNSVDVPLFTLSTNGKLLQWDWPTDAPSGWTIQRSLDGSTGWTNIGSVGGGLIQLTAPFTGYYRLFGVDSTGTQSTPLSNVVYVSNLVLTFTSPSLTWAWGAGVTGPGTIPAGWTIQVSMDGIDGWVNVVKGPTSEADKTWNPPSSGYYRVFGHDVTGNKSTDYSNVVVATV